jgi:hypothetical protein
MVAMAVCNSLWITQVISDETVAVRGDETVAFMVMKR